MYINFAIIVGLILFSGLVKYPKENWEMGGFSLETKD